MARRAAEAGASFFAANPLLLKPCSRPTYRSFVREHFPSLQQEYAKRFGNADFAAPAYAREMAQMVERVCRRHGLGERFKDSSLPQNNEPMRRPPAGISRAVQQRLFA